MQARTTLPFTSISQAPQLPPMQPVGMLTPASEAATSQSCPTLVWVVRPLGQHTGIVVWLKTLAEESFNHRSSPKKAPRPVWAEGIGECEV